MKAEQDASSSTEGLAGRQQWQPRGQGVREGYGAQAEVCPWTGLREGGWIQLVRAAKAGIPGMPVSGLCQNPKGKDDSQVVEEALDLLCDLGPLPPLLNFPSVQTEDWIRSEMPSRFHLMW